METEDLQIDDWVNVFDAPKQIEGIRKFQNGDEIVYYDGDNGNFIKAVTPIPLTPEILEKNGYACKRSLDEEIISYNWISPDRRVILNDTNGSPWFCIIYSKGMMREVMIGVKYVHEFQHALKMCGIEKEIIL